MQQQILTQQAEYGVRFRNVWYLNFGAWSDRLSGNSSSALHDVLDIFYLSVLQATSLE